MWIWMTAAAMPLLALAAAAISEPSGTLPTDDGLEAVVTIQDIMKNLVDPSADALWAAVSSTATASGTEDHQPKTEEEWQSVRRYAVTLAEAPNLLLTPGRRVADAGGKLEDAHVEGILGPREIAGEIAAGRPAFVKRASALRLAAKEALAAINARNVAQLFEAGSALDDACEACHVKFWYPNDTRPPPPLNPNLAPRK